MSQPVKPWVIGNWKMNLDRRAAETLAKEVADDPACGAVIRVGLAPPFPYLEHVAEILGHGPVTLLGQDLHSEPRGAYTGSVSGPMLRDMGVTHVLVGHSERRRLHGEDDDMIRRKITAAVKAGLTPVVCVGEDLAQRESHRAMTTITAQVEAALPADGWPGQGEILVAYEPVWAIGTGHVAGREQVAEIHAGIRRLLPGHARILYGGSVDPDNAASLAREEEIDGLLVGSASLSAASFLAIVRATTQA
ncbi:MAG: triose-phosphate isomerase [Acidobacteria bacterium]|nr:triose-phosphate isomerase [Acidobacteriota bacterium]